jgi:hypothetical protein
LENTYPTRKPLTNRIIKKSQLPIAWIGSETDTSFVILNENKTNAGNGVEMDGMDNGNGTNKMNDEIMTDEWMTDGYGGVYCRDARALL